MAETKSTSKSVAKKDENKSGVPAEFMNDLEQDAGLGARDATTDDMIIPFIKLAQALSPEVNKREAEYIQGLEQGDFFNSATQELWKGDEGFYFIPVTYQRKYLEWTPRSQGGGFQGEHEASIMNEATWDDDDFVYKLKNGNHVEPTATWYVLVVDTKTGDSQQAVIALSKSQLKKSRQLMTKLKSITLKGKSGRFNPPIFYNLVHATSVPESNDQGSWFGWSLKLDGNVFQVTDGEELYHSAKNFLEAVNTGQVKAAEPTEGTTDPGPQPEGGRDEQDDEIPF